MPATALKEQIRHSLSRYPKEELEGALREILSDLGGEDKVRHLAQYQQILKEKDQLIGGIQLKAIALAGALRESDRLLRLCVALMKGGKVKVPLEIAEHLGMIPSLRPEPQTFRAYQQR